MKQKNVENAQCKYTIRGFKLHFPSGFDVAVAVAAAFDAGLFFVLLLYLWFENKFQTKMKVKASGEWTEQNNGRSAHCK